MQVMHVTVGTARLASKGSPLFIAPAEVIRATRSDDLATPREHASKWRSETMGIADQYLTDAALEDLLAVAQEHHQNTFARTVSAVQSARTGNYPPIPNIDAAEALIKEFLRENMIDGWVYVQEADGYLHPYMVSAIKFEHADSTRGARIKLTMEADSPTVQRPSRTPRLILLEDSEIVGKTPEQALTAQGAFRETPELKAEYEARRAQYQEIIDDGFASQYTFSGTAIRTEDFKSPKTRHHRKVIQDVQPENIAPLRGVAPSALFETGELAPVPVVTAVAVFDLAAQDFIDVNISDLTPYEYDENLRDKLVLPAEHVELLDILTSDISVFTGDVIEGKSAGNVILARGRPGVGKTLTAEVYAEVSHRPLYSIHTGTLGINPESIRKNLETAFERAKRWDAVLLLDEADVFVMTRGMDMEQNAIVAEFLRTLEYYDGLLFLTTNRVDGVDEAILARCAVVIDYHLPTPEDARKIWQLLAEGNDVTLEEDLLDQLTASFPTMTPRDIKMVLRLGLRMAAFRKQPINLDVFIAAARYRGIHPDN